MVSARLPSTPRTRKARMIFRTPRDSELGAAAAAANIAGRELVTAAMPEREPDTAGIPAREMGTGPDDLGGSEAGKAGLSMGIKTLTPVRKNWRAASQVSRTSQRSLVIKI